MLMPGQSRVSNESQPLELHMSGVSLESGGGVKRPLVSPVSMGGVVSLALHSIDMVALTLPHNSSIGYFVCGEDGVVDIRYSH
jgi:hypothetical protein